MLFCVSKKTRRLWRWRACWKIRSLWLQNFLRTLLLYRTLRYSWHWTNVRKNSLVEQCAKLNPPSKKKQVPVKSDFISLSLPGFFWQPRSVLFCKKTVIFEIIIFEVILIFFGTDVRREENRTTWRFFFEERTTSNCLKNNYHIALVK